MASISFFADSHASRFYDTPLECARSKAKMWMAYLFTPVSMGPCHADRHFAEVGDFLPLEAVEVTLDG